jgi:uncharacterized membrane protein
MWFRFHLWLSDPSKNLWVTPTLGAVFAIAFSLLATLSHYFIPAYLVPNITNSSLNDLLNIIASSMLAVSTFSLSIMVSAFTSASNSGTPRAYHLMLSDDNTRVAIASFISAFIYSVIAKIALGLQSYGSSGRFVLFISTIIVLCYLIFTLIRWVQTLSHLGTLSNTIEKIESTTIKSLANFRHQSNFGATALRPIQKPFATISTNTTGYLTHFDIQGLQDIAEEYEIYIHINELPGKFLSPNTSLFEIYADRLDDEILTRLKSRALAVVATGKNRNFDQDPRFGLLVISEVAQRALSPAVNDPGTAITVMHAITRMIIDTQPTKDAELKDYNRISICEMPVANFITHAFFPIARDAAENIEVHIRLFKCLGLIFKEAPEADIRIAAKKMAFDLSQRCEKNFSFEDDLIKIKQVLQNSFGI